MNEELKIIIRAVSEDAQRNLSEVRSELDRIKESSKKSSGEVDAALAGFAKGAAAAVAAITALTAAMKSLGQAAQDVQKGFAKLNTTFLNAGATTKQASKTYQELFAFLGDHDKAVETAQSLALITTNEEELAKWTTTLQGAFAQMGDKLPIEGLAEAANEAANVGSVVGVLADALNWAGISEDAFNESLAQANSIEERQALILNTLNGLYGNSAKLYAQNNQQTMRYNESQAKLNLTLAAAASYTTPLLTSLNELSITLLTSFGPALETIAVYLTAFIQLLAEAIQWVGSFFGMFSGGSDDAVADIDGYRAAVQAYQEALRESIQGTNSGLKDELANINAIKKATMGFDELNIVSKPVSTSTGGSTGGGGGGSANLPAAPNPNDYGIGMGAIDMSGMAEAIETAKGHLEGIAVIVGTIGAGFVAWKIGTAISDFRKLKTEIGDLKEVWEQLADPVSKAFGMAGKDADDAVKEVDASLKQANKEMDAMKDKWKTIGGIAMTIAGAVMLVFGYADAWVNGLDWQNFALILGGIGLIVGGLYISFGALAAQVALIFGGVAMLVIGIKDLVENGYSMEGVLMVLAGAIAVAVGLMWAFNAALLANPITWIVIAIAALVAAFVILWNECDAFRQFWINLWDGIVNVFNAVVDWIGQACVDIGNFFVGLWEGIKNVFSGIGQWFSNLWNGVVSVFSKVGTAIGDAISNAVKGAINWIIDKAVGLINGFIKGINWAIDVINLIPGVSISRLSLLEVPKLATGGITNGATMAMIGEAGKEAVLPLENNTGWMDVLADRIAARNNTPSKIVLQVNGRELGYATIDSMNDIYRQTGTIPLMV